MHSVAERAYAVPDASLVTRKLKALRCVVEAPIERCRQWLYHAEAGAGDLAHRGRVGVRQVEHVGEQVGQAVLAIEAGQHRTSSFQSVDAAQLDDVVGGCASGCGQAGCNCHNGRRGQGSAVPGTTVFSVPRSRFPFGWAR